MKRYIVRGFKNDIWGFWEITTIPEMIERRATEHNIIITSINET